LFCIALCLPGVILTSSAVYTQTTCFSFSQGQSFTIIQNIGIIIINIFNYLRLQTAGMMTEHSKRTYSKVSVYYFSLFISKILFHSHVTRQLTMCVTDSVYS